MKKVLLSILLASTLAVPATAAVIRSSNPNGVIVVGSNMVVGNGGVSMPGMRVGGDTVAMDDDDDDGGYDDDVLVSNDSISTTGSTVNSSVSSHVVNGSGTTRTRVTTTQNGKPVTHYSGKTSTQSGVGKRSYRRGNCTVERKWVGSMMKESTICP